MDTLYQQELAEVFKLAGREAVEYLLQQLEDSNVYGYLYFADGNCGCILGTLCIAKGVTAEQIEMSGEADYLNGWQDLIIETLHLPKPLSYVADGLLYHFENEYMTIDVYDDKRQEVIDYVKEWLNEPNLS